MARYQADEEPMYYQPYVPGKVVVSRAWFAITAVLSLVGILAIITVILV